MNGIAKMLIYNKLAGYLSGKFVNYDVYHRLKLRKR